MFLRTKACAICFFASRRRPACNVPQWSSEILDEVDRTHAKLKWPPELCSYFREQVEHAFPEAMISGHEAYLPLASNDAKDRHVLAAAICAKVELLITFNLRHFPHAALEPFGITARHPADYLITLYGMNSGVVVSKLEAIARSRKCAPGDVLKTLHKSIPAFALHVADALDWPLTE